MEIREVVGRRGGNFAIIVAEKIATDARFALELSYLEVYNETIRDLLDESGAESAQTGGLALRQDARNGATVCGLTWHAPDAASDVLEMLERGNARRAVGATRLERTRVARGETTEPGEVAEATTDMAIRGEGVKWRKIGHLSRP